MVYLPIDHSAPLFTSLENQLSLFASTQQKLSSKSPSPDSSGKPLRHRNRINFSRCLKKENWLLVDSKVRSTTASPLRFRFHVWPHIEAPQKADVWTEFSQISNNASYIIGHGVWKISAELVIEASWNPLGSLPRTILYADDVQSRRRLCCRRVESRTRTCWRCKAQ